MSGHRDFWSELLLRLYPQRSSEHSPDRASDKNTGKRGISSEARLAPGDQRESVKPHKNSRNQ
jgi:hypothetical protein